mgnify:FL=1
MSIAEAIYSAVLLFVFFVVEYATFKLCNKLLKLKLETKIILQAAGLALAVSLIPSPFSDVGLLLVPLIPIAYKVSGKQLLFFALLNAAFSFLCLFIISLSVMGAIFASIKMLLS